MPPKSPERRYLRHFKAFWCNFRAPKAISGCLGAFLGHQKAPNSPNTERPTGHLPCTSDGQSAPAIHKNNSYFFVFFFFSFFLLHGPRRRLGPGAMHLLHLLYLRHWLCGSFSHHQTVRTVAARSSQQDLRSCRL